MWETAEKGRGRKGLKGHGEGKSRAFRGRSLPPLGGKPKKKGRSG